MSDERLSEAILGVADAVEAHADELLAANAADLARMDAASPLYDRLQLTPARLAAIAADMRHVASLPSPLDRTLEDRTLPNGLHLVRRTVPYGVVGVVYEARPNVTFDVFSLTLKSGNAAVLKGGSDARDTNAAAARVIRAALEAAGLPPDALTLLPPTHEATAEMLAAEGLIDVVIPRGGRRLIDFVRHSARVPVIETGAGVVHTYVDAAADIPMATRIVLNAKTRRVSVCNALDCLIVHRSRLADLPAIAAPLLEKGVEIRADGEAYTALAGYEATAGGCVPSLLRHATDDDFGTEFMAMRMAVKTVGSLAEALDHIARYGSRHSEAIVTDDPEAASIFQRQVDAACVYVNASTAFTDGGQFGLGAEIGISTQKLGVRGPMGLDALTTYKWLISGCGQVRES